MVTTQLLPATSFSSPQLWLPIMSSGNKMTRDMLGLLLHLPCQVQFFLEWWERQILQALCSDHSPLWRPVGIFYLFHSALYAALWGLFLHIVKPLILDRTDGCISSYIHLISTSSLLWAICGPALCSVLPAPVHLHWVRWTEVHGASSCCLWVHRPQCTGAAAGPHRDMCP